MSFLVADTVNVGNVYNNIGNLYLKINSMDSAIYYLQKGLYFRQQINDYFGIARSMTVISAYHIIRKEYDKALQILHNVLPLVELNNDLNTYKKVLEDISYIYETKGMIDSSLFYYKEFKYISDSIRTENIAATITKLEMEFEYEQKQKSALIQYQRERFKFMTIIIVLISVLLFVVLLYFFMRNRIKNINLIRKNLELEKMNLNQQLEIKNKELATNVIFLVKKNELLNSISKKLIQLKQKLIPENQPYLQRIIYELQGNFSDDIWKEFEVRFQNVHSDFYTKLSTNFSDLTPNEIKLCAFLKLNLNTKEIAALLNRSEKSVAVARTRLRKKLNLTNQDTDLLNFLNQI